MTVSDHGVAQRPVAVPGDGVVDDDAARDVAARSPGRRGGAAVEASPDVPVQRGGQRELAVHRAGVRVEQQLRRVARRPGHGS